MKVFRLLAFRRLRQQPLRAVIAIVAVAAGVTLAVAIGVVTTSVDRSVTEFGRSLAGPAPLRIVGATSKGGLTLEAVAAAEATEGVAAVVPMVQAVSLVDVGAGGSGGADATSAAPDDPVPVIVLGIDCRAVVLVGDFPCDDATLAAAGDTPIAVGIGLSELIGPGASLRTDLGRVPLDGVAPIAALDALNEGRVVLFALAGASHRFLQDGRVDVAYVLPATGSDLGAVRADLDRAVGEQNAVLGALDPPPETQIVLLTFLPLFSLLGLFGLGTAAVLVHNTVTLSLEERRRQFAITGALGATARTLVGGTVAEAGLLGMLGGVLGTLGGIGVAGPIVGSLSRFTESVAGVALHREASTSIVVIGVVLGAVVGAGSALGPARRALRLDVAAELSGRGGVAEAKPARLRRRLVAWGSITAVATAGCWASQLGGGIEAWQATVGPFAFLGVAIATLFLGAAAAPMILGVLARSAGRSRRAPLMLALANLVRDPRRVGVMAVAVASPMVIGFATDGFVSSARRGITEAFADSEAGVSVSTIGVNEGDDAFLGPATLAQLAALPGVADVRQGTFVSAGHSLGDIVGVSAFQEADISDARTLAGPADQARFEAGEVLIGPGLARRTGAREGDTVTVPTPTGIVGLTVLAVVENGDFGGFNIVTTYDRLVALFGTQPPAFVVLRPVDGVTEEALAASVLAAKAGIDPELRVITTEQLVSDIVESIDVQMLPFRVMQRSLTFVAFVAVLSTLLLAGLQRRREHGLLAAVGTTPPELARVVLTEAGAVGVIACIYALFIAPLVLWAMLQVIPVLIGNRNPFQADWTSLVTTGATSMVVALLGAAWPAWRAGRVEVLDALRYE